VVPRFTAHVSDHFLFPVQQCAYRRFHSTETAILSVHNDPARSADSNHVSLLVLLDLIAAFESTRSIMAYCWMSCHAGSTLQIQLSAGSSRILAAVRRHSCTTNSRPTLSRLTAVYTAYVKFAAFTEDIVDVVDRHQMRLHLYADDT